MNSDEYGGYKIAYKRELEYVQKLRKENGILKQALEHQCYYMYEFIECLEDCNYKDVCPVAIRGDKDDTKDS